MASPDPGTDQRYEGISGLQKTIIQWTLARGGAVKVNRLPGLENLAAEWRSMMDELVERGFAVKSRRGWYWGAGKKP
jgi:hypothetical protein